MNEDTRQSFLSYFKKKLPGTGQEIAVNVAGQFFTCADIEGGNGEPFQMRFDSHPWFEMNMGLGFRLPAPDRYKQLFFRNPTGVEMTVSFYAGSTQVEDARLNIVRGRSVPIAVDKTVCRAGGPAGLSQIPAMTNVDLEDVPTGCTYRKCVIVTNLDPAVDLDIYTKDSTGTYVLSGAVFFRQALILETSDAVRIRNASAGPVNCRILELFYLA